MYLFGGPSNTVSSTDKHPLPPFFFLDLKTFKFEPIYARGDLPVPRDEHTALLYESSMVIFGGFELNGERVNDIYRYYFKENKWEKVLVMGGDKPSPRAGHSAVMMGD
jgi:Rab9 effector protein with kelch motifs